ncbi:unnamed protein product [Clonostachys rosea f. rosea IK726]|uniref:Uncharacterized protein n=1 Tax=Clonostachys rosea f. rosea IK726 TaxID=1349383 RepID=A0ACA9TIQ9_BIOOC|nr:unnamed protein product [Clonostachys rosea f. rosea IK726]
MYVDNIQLRCQSPGSTTLRTVTTMRGESGSEDPNTFYQPLPTDIVTTPPKVKDELPSNPDYPWGGGSPIHRHQIVDEPKEHASNSIGARSKIKNWLWGRSVKRLKPRWFETPPNDQDGSGE